MSGLGSTSTSIPLVVSVRLRMIHSLPILSGNADSAISVMWSRMYCAWSLMPVYFSFSRMTSPSITSPSDRVCSFISGSFFRLARSRVSRPRMISSIIGIGSGTTRSSRKRARINRNSSLNFSRLAKAINIRMRVLGFNSYGVSCGCYIDFFNIVSCIQNANMLSMALDGYQKS